MLEWLDNNNNSMHPTHNECKSLIAEMFTESLKAKIYKKMETNDSKSYVSHLNQLVDQYNNTSHHSVKKNLLMLIILLWLKKSIRILKLLNLKLITESKLLSTRIFLVKATLNVGEEKSLFLILF